MTMHFKYRISASLAGLALLAGSFVVPALAQAQNTPTPVPGQSTPTPTPTQVTPDAPDAPDAPDTGAKDTLTPEEEAEIKQELSASDEQVEQLINEDAEEVTPNQETPVAPDPGVPSKLQVAAPQNNQKRALAAARGQIGYKETGRDCNKFSRYFGRGCQYWCADFVSWAFDSTGDRNKKLPWRNPSAVASILQWAQKNNKLVKTPQPGDIFIMKGRGASHTGLVQQVAKDGKTFLTVEGNASEKVRTVRRSFNKYPYRFVRVRSQPKL
jgi:hypothetical protein